jgi:hypothetical protein
MRGDLLSWLQKLIENFKAEKAGNAIWRRERASGKIDCVHGD